MNSGRREPDVDVLILGGGAAGLWLLDELHRRGFATLLVERHALGAGQTVASQGIIHGGVKYTLRGWMTRSARAIRAMPARWQASLAGREQPDLSHVRVLSPACHLWRTDSVKSRVGTVGARMGLQTTVEKVPVADRPPVLAQCPGDIFSVQEPVIDTVSFLRAMADLHRDRIARVADWEGLVPDRDGRASVNRITLLHPDGGAGMDVRSRRIILAAGAGNEELRRRIGLPPGAMQRRPLHMVMMRGMMPELFGHCVDGHKTRVTITSAMDDAGRTIWQLGGDLAERGVRMAPGDLIPYARKELAAVLPGVSFDGTHWAAYAIDRAEGRTRSGLRPDGPVVRFEGSIVTAWPTKLALAPHLAASITDALGKDLAPSGPPVFVLDPAWPRPPIARRPWEDAAQWHPWQTD